MKLPSFAVLALPDFEGGPLNVTLSSQAPELCADRQIQAPGPGLLLISTLFRGPKEWSPFGLVDKKWIEIFKIDGGIFHVAAEYMTSGHQFRVASFARVAPRKASVFFSPTTVLTAKKP